MAENSKLLKNARPGPKGPNPIDANAVLAWYDANARDLPWRTSPVDRRAGIKSDPYRIWLSEIMLQQTTVATVGKYFVRFTSLWPAVADLAKAPLEAVLVEWAGLGYYARARNLHACAHVIMTEHGGKFPARADELITLPGIGPYTAAAIAAIANDEAIAVVDGNVERVLARYLALKTPVRDHKPLIRTTVQAAVPERAGDFAQALMDIGATICAPRAALCEQCPLQPGCGANKTSDPLAFPAKPVKAERPVRFGHAFVMRDPTGDVYLRSRGKKGLLAQMTETPTSAWTSTPSEPIFPVPGEWRTRGEIVHVFTHFRLQLRVWSLTVSDPSVLTKGWWTDPRELENEALPTLFRKVLAAASVG